MTWLTINPKNDSQNVSNITFIDKAYIWLTETWFGSGISDGSLGFGTRLFKLTLSSWGGKAGGMVEWILLLLTTMGLWCEGMNWPYEPLEDVGLRRFSSICLSSEFNADMTSKSDFFI